MVQIIEQNDPFGRIGAGIGKGLSEQIPKEIERRRLSTGLRNLAASQENNPFERLANIYSIPGITPEIASQASQYLQQQQAKREAEGNYRRESAASIPGEKQNLPPARRNELENYLLPRSQEEINAEGASLSINNPNLYPTIESGIAEAQKREASRIALDEAFEKRQNLTKEELTASLDRYLQKEGAGKYADVSGPLQGIYQVKALEDVAAGKLSPKQAAEKYAKEAYEFAKSRLALKELGGFFSKRITGKDEIRKRIDTIREAYDKLDQKEYFENDLMAYQGNSLPFAKYLAHPANENKEVNNYFSKLQNVSPLFNILPEHRAAKERGGSQFKGKSATEEEIASFVKQHLKPSDSLLAFALRLNGRGYDPQKFLDQFVGDKKISVEQQHELEHRGRIRPNLNDAFLFSQAGLDKIMEQL